PQLRLFSARVGTEVRKTRRTLRHVSIETPSMSKGSRTNAKKACAGYLRRRRHAQITCACPPASAIACCHTTCAFADGDMRKLRAPMNPCLRLTSTTLTPLEIGHYMRSQGYTKSPHTSRPATRNSPRPITVAATTV